MAHVADTASSGSFVIRKHVAADELFWKDGDHEVDRDVAEEVDDCVGARKVLVKPVPDRNFETTNDRRGHVTDAATRG